MIERLPDWLSDRLPLWLVRRHNRRLLRNSREDLQLQKFFTNVEDLLSYFTQQLTSTTLRNPLLVIHGLGGVGKSTLLIMFRFLCEERRIPEALASGGESVSEVQVLQVLAESLAGYGVKLRSFNKTVKRYRSIQAKVGTEASKLRGPMSTTVGTVVGLLAGPFVGAFLGPVIGKGTNVAIEWLRSLLSAPDLELLLEPAKKLTRDFLIDLTTIAKRHRLVLMLDHFEQLTPIDSWIRDLAEHLPSNVLLVIAGRQPPDWDRAWQGWVGLARIEELREMSEENMRKLVRRYYFMNRQTEPDPSQVNEIISFARGLPLVVTTTVGLWVKYGVENFSAVKSQVVADLVDRIMEGVPGRLRPLLEAAASVRWFNKDVLKAVAGISINDESYRELRNFEFMRPRLEGLFMHDVVREIIDDNLRTQNPTQHTIYHRAAAVYFEDCRKSATDNERERFLLEQLYHLLRADEDDGVVFFRQLSEEMSRARLVRQLRTLVGELGSHSLREPNRLWRDYYSTRVLHLEARFQEAEVGYQSISSNAQSEDLLKAYSLCGLGNILTRWERLGQVDGPSKADRVLRLALDSRTLDIHLSNGLFDIARVHEYLGEWDRATDYIEKARRFFEQSNDNLGTIYSLNELLAAYVLQGDWRRMLVAQQKSLDLLASLPEYRYLKAKTLGYWSWAWPMAGRCAEAETSLKESVNFMRQVEDLVTLPTFLRNLGLSIGMQRRYDEAYTHLDESIELAKARGDEFKENRATSMSVLGMLLVKQGNYAKAKDYLDEGLRVKTEVRDNLGISEAMVWLAMLYEAQQEWSQAVELYQHSLDWKWTGRRYYETAALAGLCRVEYQQRRIDHLAPLLSEAENLAIKYEYYDHLSSLRVIQGNLAWEAESAQRSTGFEAVRRSYHQALVYALRYNRFLLDDTMDTIAAYCRERSGEGDRMLTSLRDSWSKGRNKVGASRSEGISPLPESISLLNAEELARKREPGNRERQVTLVERLERSLRSG